MTPYDKLLSNQKYMVNIHQSILDEYTKKLNNISNWSKDKIARYNKIYTLQFKKNRTIKMPAYSIYVEKGELVSKYLTRQDIDAYCDGEINDIQLKIVENDKTVTKSIWRV